MSEVYLDGIFVSEEPEGLTEITEHLYYSVELSTYLLEIDGNLIFRGSEYTYLRDKWEEAVCQEVTVTIKIEGQEDFNGIIKVADITWHPDRYLADCEIQDDNITALVVNNKQIETIITTGKTKNNITYTVTQQTDIEIPNPTDSSSVTNRSGLRIFDAFTSMITFISDGELGFVSDYFDYNSNGDPQVYGVLMTGASIRTGLSNDVSISFAELFGDLNNEENLAMSFEDGNIRIEDKAYYKAQGEGTVSFEDVEGLTQELDQSTLYAKVKFGSFEDYDLDGGGTIYLPDIRFNVTRDEEYHLGGQCNLDTTLDLKNTKIITDTNIIQDALPALQGGTNNDSHDDSVFLLHLDSNNKAVLTLQPASTTDYYFNDRYINYRIAERWFGQIPQSIYAYLGEGQDGVYVESSVDVYNDGSITGTTDNYFGDVETPDPPYHDANNNYAQATVTFPYVAFDYDDELLSGLNSRLIQLGLYVAPANGVYSFDADLYGNVDSLTAYNKVYFGLIRPVAPILFSSRIIPIESTTGSIHHYQGGATFYMNAGDYVGIGFFEGFINAGGTFTCHDPLGGVWQTYDSQSVWQVINKFNYPIPSQDWRDIKNTPFKSILATYQTGQVDTWLSDISRRLDGTTEIEMLSQNG